MSISQRPSSVGTAHTVAKSQFLFKKIKFSIIPFFAGKFKFDVGHVGVDFIKIEFLDKNIDFASVCSRSRSTLQVPDRFSKWLFSH